MKTQDGSTLIELAFGAGFALMTLLLAFHLISQQVAELQNLKNGIEINSSQVEIQRALMDPAVCASNFRAPFAIDETRLSDPSYSLPLMEITEDTAGARSLVRQGTPLNPSATHITVTQIRIADIVRIASNSFRFILNVQLAAQDGRPMVPIRVPRLHVSTDPLSPINAKRPISCSSSGTGGGGAGAGGCVLVQQDSPGINRVDALCDDGFALASGGAECLTPGGNSWTPMTPFNIFGYVRISAPIQSGGRWGWQADCFNDVNNVVRSRAYAYCCPN